MQDGFPVFLFGISFMLNLDTGLSAWRINDLIIFTIHLLSDLQAKVCTILNNLLHQHDKLISYTVIKSCYTAVYKQKRQIQVLRTVQRIRGQHSLGRRKRSSETTFSKNDTDRRCNSAQGFRFRLSVPSSPV